MNLSETIKIELGLIEVYPNQKQKPPPKSGLNVPANLYFFHISSKRHDSDAAKFEAKIRKWAGELPHSRFVAYNPDLQVLQITTTHF